MNLKEELKAGLAELGLALSAPQELLLVHYVELLDKWNRVYNLTAVRETGRMLSYHVLDSLAALPLVAGQRILDVGSGGGMPGIPFAISQPDWSLTLLDANHKKTTFLKQAVIELGLTNTEVVCERVETFQPERKFDVITSRAFSDLAEFVRLTRHLLAEGGEWAALKGVYPDEEIAQLPEDVCVREVIELKVPGLDAERHLVKLGLR
ncbi:16S rRNA (guanine(527)-N(7))-methyltransferase RsmG [Laribacter hongkongensis]|uniref:16S rRNA (guanine(527)-N(7))-methyltransferase RsmG n=1 Tax=Laribacter hongkongensis TaxID=168471 RepID=UPI001EFD5F43|nr:16S rRNA (guanine(527)-N(7))-methyltransferase RsmG [Laribacter hongkongensis]MCG9098732.1 16S rRNA (guanine(527)-N(7))-methyltransferase RsmG [Laribacter hongkongensis]